MAEVRRRRLHFPFSDLTKLVNHTISIWLYQKVYIADHVQEEATGQMGGPKTFREPKISLETKVELKKNQMLLKLQHPGLKAVVGSRTQR